MPDSRSKPDRSARPGFDYVAGYFRVSEQCDRAEAERDRLQAENEHLRKSIANSDRDHWFEEAGRLREASGAVISAWDAMDGSDAHRGALMGAFGGLRLALSSDETSVASSGAGDVEITGRSWDPKAAGRRAVEKHGDALKRLSDEQGASDA